MNQKGFTLVELMMVVAITAIALVAASMPFMMEQSFWRTGRQRTAAQQDAQMVMRAIARTARTGTGYVVGQGNTSVTFNLPGCNRVFQLFNGNQLQVVDNCVAPPETKTLIDGGLSDVTQFVVTPIVPNRLVEIQVEVTQGTQERELLRTQIFLRNAP